MSKNKNRWLLATNTNNLRMIIAQGLICSPIGFEKYYDDTLSLNKGFIPLFNKHIPKYALDIVVSEKDYLTACIIEIDLKSVAGTVKCVKNGAILDIEIENIDTDIDQLWILAPLPISCIASIIFKSDNDKQTFETKANSRRNVILENLKLNSSKKDKKLFDLSGNPQELIDQVDVNSFVTENLINDKVDYKRVYAFGGLLLNLFYFAKNGALSNKIYQYFSSLQKDDSDENVSLIHNYFYDKAVIEESVAQKIWTKLIQISINNKDFKDEVINFLESNTLDDPVKEKAQNIAKKLREFEENDATILEKFEKSNKPLEKILFMLFLREDSQALIEFDFDLYSNVFKELDYLNFAMLFGIRNGFINSPGYLRKCLGLQSFISTKMANYAHENSNNDSNIKFKEPLSPLTLQDMLKKDKFKIKIIQELNLEVCMTTKMPNRDKCTINGEDIYKGLVFSKFLINEDVFFKKISNIKLTAEQYNKFTKIK